MPSSEEQDPENPLSYKLSIDSSNHKMDHNTPYLIKMLYPCPWSSWEVTFLVSLNTHLYSKTPFGGISIPLINIPMKKLEKHWKELKCWVTFKQYFCDYLEIERNQFLVGGQRDNAEFRVDATDLYGSVATLEERDSDYGWSNFEYRLKQWRFDPKHDSRVV